jgi:hypothetical protein
MSLFDRLRRFSPSLLTRMVVALAIAGLVPMGFAVSRLIGITQAAITE